MALKIVNGADPPIIVENIEYLPLYYMIPPEIFPDKAKLLEKIPRTPHQVLYDRGAQEVIGSNDFMLYLTYSISLLVWPYIDNRVDWESYSTDDPCRMFTHRIDIWLQEMIDAELMPPCHELLANMAISVYPPSPQLLHVVFSKFVPYVMEKYGMYEILEVIREHRCFEDYDIRSSPQKKDFRRKWYHTRTKHPLVSLETYQANQRKGLDTNERDIVDGSINLEDDAVANTLVEQFKATLSEKDLKILTMRVEGYTMEEIADKLGYKNHSGVLKRIRKIGIAYEEFTGEDHGFKSNKKK